jgi:hypothetical protein
MLVLLGSDQPKCTMMDFWESIAQAVSVGIW